MISLEVNFINYSYLILNDIYAFNEIQTLNKILKYETIMYFFELFYNFLFTVIIILQIIAKQVQMIPLIFLFNFYLFTLVL